MYAVIGDVVKSRQLADRERTQADLVVALAETAVAVPGVQPLEPTVGDEFQGAYATLGDATHVALLIRLRILPQADVRLGIGFGETTVYDRTRRPLLQDGPAWWAAREALEHLARPRRSTQRTWYVGPESARANAFLLCRDALVDRLSDRGWRMLRMSLQGSSQREIAEAEGISTSAVSQQFARGITAVREAQALFDANT
jgi:hypothetical protein